MASLPLRASHSCISKAQLTLRWLSWFSAEQAQGPHRGQSWGGCSCRDHKGYTSVKLEAWQGARSRKSLRPQHSFPAPTGVLVTAGHSAGHYASHTIAFHQATAQGSELSAQATHCLVLLQSEKQEAGQLWPSSLLAGWQDRPVSDTSGFSG